MKNKVLKTVAAGLVMSMILTACGDAGISDAGGASSSGAGEEMAEITYATWTINTLPSEEAIQAVEDKINEITEDKINVHVNFVLYSNTDYNNKVALNLQSGEQIDLFTSYGSFLTEVAQDMCYDITDLADEYLPDAREYISDEWMAATTVDGRVYGVPSWMPVALKLYVSYREDIAEDMGLDMESVNSVEDLTSVLEQVYEAYPDMYAMTGGAGLNGGQMGVSNSIPEVDYLGDSRYAPAGVLIGDSTTVVDLFETEEYEERVKLAREWYEKGLVMQDLATTTLTGNDISATGKSFAQITMQGSSQGALSKANTAQTGYPYTGKFIGDAYLDTASVNENAWCVSSTCENPEAALKFLNLTYCDEDLINLIVFGIEGRDYVINEDGSIQPPEGYESTSVPYPGYYILTGNWSMGKTYRQTGTTQEDVEWNVKSAEEAKVSPAMGFTFDNSKVKIQYTAVTNVINQYYAALDCGSVDPDTELPKFIQALKDAGMDDIVAAKQEQLDAWLAGQ